MKAAKKVADQIKLAREESNLTQSELSKLSGLTQMTISTIETYKRESKISTAEKLAKVMGYELEINFIKKGK